MWMQAGHRPWVAQWPLTTENVLFIQVTACCEGNSGCKAFDAKSVLGSDLIRLKNLAHLGLEEGC